VKKKLFNIIETIVLYILSAIVIVGAVLFAVNTSPNKSIFGYRYYTVLTESMSPNYNVGDVVIVHIEDADTISVGDVITFNPSSDSEAYLTHRVTEKLQNYENSGVTCFKTKGDANSDEDGFLIDERRVVGRVTAGIPKIGYIIRFIQLRWYFTAAIVIMVIVLIKMLKAYFSLSEEDSNESPREPDSPQPAQ